MPYYYIAKLTQVTPLSGTSITQVQQLIVEQKVKSYVKSVEDHKDDITEMFNVIHIQRTKEFINQMRIYPEYELPNDKSNVVSLVEII